MSGHFSEVLGKLAFGDKVLDWLKQAMRESHADQRRDHEAAIKRLQAEHDRLQNRLHVMYLDKLDGRIDNSFWAQMSEQWRIEQDKITQEILRHQAADRSYIDEGIGILELAKSAQGLFVKQSAAEQRRLLDCVLSHSTWKCGALTPTFRQPFDLISETTAAALDAGGAGALNSPEHTGWLGDLDSNQD